MLVRFGRWSARVGIALALWISGTMVIAGDPLSPLPPVSATPLQSSDSGQTVEPLPPVHTEPPAVAAPSLDPAWLREDQPGVTGCDAGCKPGCLYCPWIYGGVDYLFWNRTGDNSVPLIADANTGDTLVSSNQLGFGSMSGARAWFGMRCNNVAAVEFGFINYFDANSSLQVSDVDLGTQLALPGDLGGASNVFFNTNRFQITYGSQFNSYEINFATCCARGCPTNCSTRSSWIGSVEWLAGFRYISLNEQLNIYGERDEIGGTETGNYNVQATNDLYGGQLGVRLRNCWGRFSAEGVLKAGLYGNNASQTQYVLDYPNFYLRDPVSANHTSLAFAGDFALTGIYQINKNWGLRAGYSLMWLDGLALAPQQLDYTFTPDSGKSLHRNGDLFLHGVHVGIEARW